MKFIHNAKNQLAKGFGCDSFTDLELYDPF